MSSRWLIGILVISVLLNAALVGLFIGQRIAFGAGPMGGGPQVGIFRWVQTLPDARRDELSGQLRPYRRAMRGGFGEVRQAHRRFRESMLTEPLDATEVRTALEELQRALQAQQAASHDGLVNILQQLSLEERQALDSHLRTRPRRPGPPR